jgi:hypothetical protein
VFLALDLLNNLEEISMFVLRNLSSQGKELIFFDGKEYCHHWLEAKASVRIPESFITPTVKTLARRKLISIKKA